MGWGPKAPDTSGINTAALQQSALNARYLDLAETQADRQEARAATFDPLYAQLIEQSMASATTQDQRSAQQWEQYQALGRPAEERAAATAANYDTTGRRDQAGAEARAAVGDQFATMRQSQARDVARTGGTISAGRGLALDNINRIEAAKAGAAADTNARRNVERTGIALNDSVINTGRGLAAGATQQAQVGLGANGTAQGALGGNQSTYNASLNPQFQALSGAGSAASSAGNLAAQIAQIQAGGQSNGLAGLAGLGQLAGAAYGMYASSKKLKTRGKPVKSKRELWDTEDAKVLNEMPTARGLSRLDNEHWKYKPKVADKIGDHAEHRGPYAEDVHREFGDAVAPGGKAIAVKPMENTRKQAARELMAEAARIMKDLQELAA
jgi:hypothetical protein